MNLRNALPRLSCAIAVSLAVAPVYAQVAAPSTDNSDELSTIVVTGVRASVKTSLDIKKNADQLQDSIVAEDIGKLPDNNVIEALQHVTGVQVSRNAAEATQLLVRGLPDIATLINGREIFTSTGRFVALQDIPAELLSRVDVRKSSRADDIEGGIAGVVDIRLHRPFDFDGFQAAVTAREVHSTLSDHNDPVLSGLVSNRWQTSAGEFGVLADISYIRDHYKEEILDNYISTQSIGPVPGSTGAGGTAFIPLTEGAQSINGDRERTAATIATQWSPNANTEVYLEGIYTRYRNPNNNDFFVGLPWICANPATATVFPGTNEVKTVTGGCYDLTSDQSFVPKTDTYQVASGLTWTGESVKFTSEIDFTTSRFSQNGYILDTQYNPPPDGYTADFNYQGTGTPYMNVTGINLFDPSQYHVRQLYDQWTVQKGNEIDWRGDFNFRLADSSWMKSVETGVRVVDRFAQNRADNAGGIDCLGPPPPQNATSVACTTQPALSALPGTAYHTTYGTQFNGQFGIRSWIDADPNWLVNNIGYLRQLWNTSATGDRPPEDPTQSFDDREVSYAGYVKGNFGMNLGSLPLSGNIGLRLVETRASMLGNTSINGVVSPVQTDKNTLDWLPSLNARLTLEDNLYLRFAASRTVTHPTFAQLDPALSLSASTATLLGSGTSGNANLNPVTSDNADLALEYYFSRQNALTAAAFYRRVDGYIQTVTDAEVINGITYQVTRPNNAPSGKIDGAEIGYTQFLDFLPAWLQGMGVQANATYVNGDFQNISKWSYNVVGIYERGPASMRVAYNWRSGFNVGGTPGGAQPLEPLTIFAKSQPWLDLSASYHIVDSLTLTFDATNLLNSYYQDYFGNQTVFPRDTRRFDRQFSLGIRYRLK
ncbi:MAG TPA: TonB-dependent receptor [Steroidobacteraceae bacterium]|jgi:TonB-dependent receptor